MAITVHIPFLQEASVRLSRRASALMLGRHCVEDLDLSAFVSRFLPRSSDDTIEVPPLVAEALRSGRAFFDKANSPYTSEPQLAGDLILAWLGFETVQSVDASGFEGAEHVFDLNRPGLLEATRRRYDLIFDAGTLEHVFHLPNALANVAECLEEGGIVLHTLPMNNAVDHGFYQFSPTLFADWYSANQFILEDISLLCVRPGLPVLRGTYVIGQPPLDCSGPGAWSVMVQARKTAKSTSDAIPQQGYYARNTDWCTGLSTQEVLQCSAS
ncbi:hypothetical protein [Azospirillum endophyticum]